jgi:uncharacterized protein (UPF0332 family)
MKRFTLLILFCFYSIFIFADEILIYKGTASNYNSMLKQMLDNDFAIKYDTEKQIFYFYSSDFMNSGWVKLTETQLISFKNTLSKYIDWEKMAIEKSVKVDKEFPDSKISTDVTWKFGDDWYTSRDLDMYFKFFSQNTKRHQFILYSNKVNSSSNQFIDYKVEPLYFDKKQVEDLINGISEDAIKKVIDKFTQSKSIEDQFK